MARQFLKYALLLAVVFSAPRAFGQSADSMKMSSLMVYGDSFTFGVKEPDGWTGDIDNAKDYYANIIFYKSKEDVNNGGALVQIQIFKKSDEKTEKDLEYDIKSYENKYKDLKKDKLSVSHKEYKCYSKLVYVADKFYQYTVYVNPGPKYKNGLSVAMNISKRAATDDELKAFQTIIGSLAMYDLKVIDSRH